MKKQTETRTPHPDLPSSDLASRTPNLESDLPEDVVLSVRNVSKKFSRSLKRSMIYGLRDIARVALLPKYARSPNLDARLEDAVREDLLTAKSAKNTKLSNQEPSTKNQERAQNGDGLRASEFWALRDISFELRRGECLGLVGNNGAGKSTLLSILSGIYGPTSGRVEIQGRLQALIALGAGFHPMLSGRENIYISGLVLGLKKEEIEAKYENIVEFAELGDFIDMPVKRYSSGMHVRLGFAVAVHMEPDVLLIDEVLAVGDIGFKNKCMDKIHELMAGDRAIILVSHSLYQIESLSQRCLWLEKGRMRMLGEAREVVRTYREEDIRLHGASRKGSTGLTITESPLLNIIRVEVLSAHGQLTDEIGYAEPFSVRIHYHAHQRIERPLFNLRFKTRGVGAFECSMLIDGNAPPSIHGDGFVECRIKAPNLLPNHYEVALFVRNHSGTADLIESVNVADFMITAAGMLKAIPSAGPYALGHLMHGRITHQEYHWLYDG